LGKSLAVPVQGEDMLLLDVQLVRSTSIVCCFHTKVADIHQRSQTERAHLMAIVLEFREKFVAVLACTWTVRLLLPAA
jgi:hypothetical protein